MERIHDKKSFNHKKRYDLHWGNNYFQPRNVKQKVQNFQGSNINNQQAKRLGITIKSAKNFKKLEIDCFGYDTTCETSLDFVRENFKKLASIQSISVRIDRFCNSNDYGLREFLRSLRSLKCLKKLELSFEKCDMTDETLYVIGRYLKPLRCLQSFSLGFTRCYYLSDKGLEDFAEGLKSWTFLKKIELAFRKSDDEISYFGMENLIESLSGLTRLQDLSIYFPQNSHIQKLGPCLGNLALLRNLNLNFDSCVEIKDFALMRVGSGLKNLKFLSNLTIKLTSCSYITDNTIHEFCEHLKSLVSLEYFEINLNECQKITDASMKDISDCFGGMNDLKSLIVDCNRCVLISDVGLKEVINSLKILKNLQYLALGFKGCEEITDVTMNNMNDYLSEFRSLKGLNLNFEGCTKITRERVRSIGEAMKIYTSFKQCRLSLPTFTE